MTSCSISDLPLPADITTCGKRKRTLTDSLEEGSPVKQKIIEDGKLLKLYKSPTNEEAENHENSPLVVKRRTARMKDLSKKLRGPSLIGLLSPTKHKTGSISRRSHTPSKRNRLHTSTPQKPPKSPVRANTMMEEQINLQTVENLSSPRSSTRSKRNSLLMLHNQEKLKEFQEALRSPVLAKKTNLPPSLSRSISLYSFPIPQKTTDANLLPDKPSKKGSLTPRDKQPKRKKKSSTALSLSLRNKRKRSVTDFKQLFGRSEKKEEEVEEKEKEVSAEKTFRYFASPLDEVMHLQRSIYGLEEYAIPYFILVSCNQIRKHFLSEQGLFRVSPSLTTLEETVDAIETSDVVGKDYLVVSECESTDKPQLNAHIYSGLIKKFLRELPEPLLVAANYQQWLACMPDIEEKKADLQNLIMELPIDNYNLLKEVCSLAYEMSQNKSANLMSTENLSRVIGPNLLWGTEITDAQDISQINHICEYLIAHFQDLFTERTMCPLIVPVITPESEEENKIEGE